MMPSRSNTGENYFPRCPICNLEVIDSYDCCNHVRFVYDFEEDGIIIENTTYEELDFLLAVPCGSSMEKFEDMCARFAFVQIPWESAVTSRRIIAVVGSENGLPVTCCEYGGVPLMLMVIGAF